MPPFRHRIDRALSCAFYHVNNNIDKTLHRGYSVHKGNMDFIKLRRKVPPIDASTPLCVIDFLTDIYGVKYTSIENQIQALSNDNIYPIIPRSGKEWDAGVWMTLARFVNPNIEWKTKHLYRAFTSIINPPPVHRRFGIRTNATPDIGDVLDAYALCYEYNIPTTRDTSFNDMTLELFIRMSPVGCRALLTTEMSKHVREMYTENDLSITVMDEPLLSDDRAVNIHPYSESDALMMGWRHGLELSLADSKLVEYYNHTLTGASNLWQCERCQYIAKINPHRLVFGVYFNPRVPIEYYTPEKLNMLAALEGINGTTQEKYSELTALAYLTNFHHLLQPEVSATHTPYLKEAFSDVPRVLIVSYGVLSFYRDEFDKSTMTAYSIHELTHMFKSKESFVNPETNERFPEHAISKLTRICKALHLSKTTEEIKNACREMLQVIEVTRDKENGTKTRVVEWVNMVRQNNAVELVVQTLLALLYTAMYMRKWDGVSAFPIRSAPQEVMTAEHDDRVYKSLEEFERLDGSISNVVSLMPLLKYEFECFQIITDPFEGLTIQQRIDIVKKGNTITEQHSCVMWSSNLLITSSYYYLMNLGYTPSSFHIGELVHMAE